MTSDGVPETGPDAGAEGPDAIEQFQRAVLTLIGAARVTLDALEAVVADRSRIDQLSAGGRDLVGSLLSVFQGRGTSDERGSDTPKP